MIHEGVSCTLASMDADRLETELKRARGRLAKSWSGVAFRGASPEFARDPEFLNGLGSMTHGNRWNPQGCVTVYGCLELDNVVAESLAATRAYGIADENALPQVL